MTDVKKEKTGDSVLVAVYGSLLRGLGNHPVIEDGTFIGEDTVSVPYKMIDLGSFPGLIPSDNGVMNNVMVEVYACDPITFRRVRRLEGFNESAPEHGMYREAITPTKYGDAIGYIYNGGGSRQDDEHIVDWKSHITAKRKNLGWY